MTAAPDPTPHHPAASDRIRRFVVDTATPLAPPGRHRYESPEAARDVPLAAAVLAVPGIAEIFIEGNAITALRTESVPWEQLEEPVRYAITTALQTGMPPASPAPSAPLSDDALFDRAATLLRRDINPAVAKHGGAVELLDVQGGVVVVRMMGGCQGCGMANVTLRQGIEESFRRQLPGYRGIRDVTDHAAGENPYFRGPATSGLPVVG